MDIEQLQRMAEGYEYGLHGIVNRDLRAIYDPVEQVLTIENYYGNDGRQGNCVRLMEAAYREIKRLLPETHVFRTKGWDPKFFQMDDQAHYFLLLTQTDLLNGLDFLSGRKLSDEMLEESLIFDPSFKLVKPFNESDYDIDYLVGKNQTFREKSTLKITDDYRVPLGITGDDIVVFLACDEDFPSYLGIELSLRGFDIGRFDIRHKFLTKFLQRDPKIVRMIEHLQKMDVEVCDEN